MSEITLHGEAPVESLGTRADARMNGARRGRVTDGVDLRICTV